jgi:hypothetical protein
MALIYLKQCLGSEVNGKNDVKMKNAFSPNEDISTHLKSYLISRKTKIALCKILVRLLAACSSETWTLTKEDDKALSLI